ncbi:MAG TPA: transketolase C-terminal domain-containing protein [Candidatus Paceibacterota bacterium]|nr:transketolase C-terminal domain-containing protein [Candidatus Paceibacterota bacterium]
MQLVPINPKIFDPKVEKFPIRKGYGEGLLAVGELNHRIVAIAADLVESTYTHHFAKKFPERFIQHGIAEQSMAAVASGMAAMGKIPFMASYAMFSPGRNWEQIRTSICYNFTNVKIVGSHAGVTVGPDGGSHQALEDIALTRVLPRMMVLVPCDHIEARKATIAAAGYEGPVYIRLCRENTAVVTAEETPFELGKAQCFFASPNPVVGIIAIGALVHEAMLAAKQLEEDGIPVKVLNMPTVKPLDEAAVLELAKEVKGIVTVEEHQIKGGLGGAVAEYLSSVHPTKIAYVGMKDEFGQSGEPMELIKFFHLDAPAIVLAAKQVIL